METEVGVRPAHYLIAEEMLHQELGRTSGDLRNWRIGLADLATRFIDLLANLPHRTRGTTSDTLRAVLIERGSSESPAGPWDTEFSPLLEDVPNVDGRRRVLEHLTDAFPEEPTSGPIWDASTAEWIRIIKRRTLLTRQQLDCCRMILCFITWRAWDGARNSTGCSSRLIITSLMNMKTK